MYSEPLLVSQLLLAATKTKLFLHHQERIPPSGPMLVVSNHRSFMDAPILMAAMNRPIRFACHHYMGEVPVMRDLVKRMGCFPLDAPAERNQSFFQKAVKLLQTQQAVGIFPEGAEPMVKETPAQQVGNFQRGFAHLALRAPVEDLAVLPIAIAANQETTNSAIPLRLLSWIDPSEPLFAQSGWHPMVVYQRVNVMIGRPYWIRPEQRQDYHGKQARSMVLDVTQACHAEINHLLVQGCY